LVLVKRLSPVTSCRGGANQIETMEKEYVISWMIDEGDGQAKDYWGREETYEEAKLLYDELLRDDRLITASLSQEINSTES
jgi:hypothetical protein